MFGKNSLFTFVGVALVSFSNSINAATFVVTNTENSGDGSLRTAITNANNTSGADTIVFEIAGNGPNVIALTSPLPTIVDDLSILNDRAGDKPVTITPATAYAFRPINIGNGIGVVVTLAGLTITNGKQSDNRSGAIYNLAGVLAVRNCTFQGNVSGARGGAILNQGFLQVLNSTFVGNSAKDGGAIGDAGNGPSTAVSNSTFSANSGTGNGGAILNTQGVLSVINCTFTANSAAVGGALYGYSQDVANSIFQHGSSGENIFTLTVVNSKGGNLSDDAAGGDSGTGPGGLLKGPGDIRNTDPQLAPLADNGGMTLTHALLSTSPAINSGNDGEAPYADQRNYSRVGVSDIGAFEFGGTPAPPPPTLITVRNTNDSGPGSLRQAIATASSGATIDFDQGLSGAITLTSGQLSIADKDLIIKGPGATTLAIDGNNNSRVFRLTSAFAFPAIKISGLTIRGGRAMSVPNSSVEGGGGIYTAVDKLTMEDCVVTGNVDIGTDAMANLPASGAAGGGIAGSGTLALINVSVSNNTAMGGNGFPSATSGAYAVGASALGGGLSFSGTLSLTNCSINENKTIGGKAGDGGSGGGAIGGRADGGGISESSGTLTIMNSVISGNSALAGNGGNAGSNDGGVGGPADGAGVLSRASDNVFTNTTVTDNIAKAGNGGNGSTGGNGQFGGSTVGGGIYAYGRLTISGSTFSGNSLTAGKGGIGNQSGRGGDASGGGIYSDGAGSAGNLALTNTTVTNNSVRAAAGGGSNNAGTGRGGGLFHNFGTLTSENNTLSDNVAASDGSNAFAPVSLGGGLYLQPNTTTVILHNTLVAHDTAVSGADVSGTVTPESSYNLVSDSSGLSGISPASNGNQLGTTSQPLDPKLGPLQDNGGLTKTRALLVGSPAINAGTDASAPTRDQRGYLRAGLPDIGAFEFAGTVPVAIGNIATRLQVQTGDNVLIGGFIISGTQPKKVIIRAIGPSLPLSGQLQDPTLELFDSTGASMASNDDWQQAPNRQEIIDSTVAPTNGHESAILMSLPPGAYTTVVRGVSDTTGIASVEVYDLDLTVNSKLANISTRGFVQTGDDVMIGGTIVVGADSQKVIIRAIGPSLDLPDKLLDPMLELYDANGALIVSNDNWRSDQEAEIIASTVPPPNDLESAIVRTLSPGPYTAIVRGSNNRTGVALVEVYALQ